MKDQTIRPGDLVMVVKPKPCGCSGQIGQVLTVLPPDGSRLHLLTCGECGWTRPHPQDSVRVGHNRYRTSDRLRKIDPPETGEYDRVPVRKSIPTTKEKA